MTDGKASDGGGGESCVTELVDRVIDLAEMPEVGLDTLIESFGRASFTPLLMIPAFAVATPLSGIPGLSSFCGIIIALVAAQMIVRRDHAWFPQWVLKRRVKGERVRAAFRKVRPVAAWMDRHTRPRLNLMLHRPLIFIPQVVCFLSGAAMPLLELVPLSSSILGTGVFFLALGMLTRDGLVAVMAILPYAAGGYFLSRFLTG